MMRLLTGSDAELAEARLLKGRTGKTLNLLLRARSLVVRHRCSVRKAVDILNENGVAPAFCLSLASLLHCDTTHVLSLCLSLCLSLVCVCVCLCLCL